MVYQAKTGRECPLCEYIGRDDDISNYLGIGWFKETTQTYLGELIKCDHKFNDTDIASLTIAIIETTEKLKLQKSMMKKFIKIKENKGK